jgi:peptide/nickel transport system substrate-binding protein
VIKRLLLLLAFVSAFAASAAAKDDLVIGISEFPSSLHPSIDPLLIKSYTLGFTLRTITTVDRNWQPICLLCTELPTLENGLVKLEDTADGGHGMAVTIQLKPDLKWADGVPVTAKDIAFTWKVGRDPNAGFSNGFPWRRATSIDVIDDHTAVLHLDRVLVSFNLWDQIIPEHIEGAAYGQNGADAGAYLKNTLYNRAPTTPGLWNGPYMMTGYQSGAQMVLEPNPYWPGPKPGFKHVVLRLIADTAALQANLLSGDIDLANNLTLDQVLALRTQYPDRFDYTFTPSTTYGHLDLQKDNPILADIRVRRALLMSIDRKTIGDKLFAGMQPIADSFVSPIDPMFDKTIPHVGYDPAGAKALLKEAGWTPGPDGICRNAKGERLSLEFLASSGIRVVQLQQQVMQSGWKQVCIDITLKDEPFRTMFGQTVKHRAFPGMVYYSWTNGLTESPRRTLDSTQIPTEANNWGGANFVAFSNKQFDADINTVETELDPAKRKLAWADMQHIYADALPALPMFYSAVPQVVPKWLKGYEPSGSGQPATFQSEYWHAE